MLKEMAGKGILIDALQECVESMERNIPSGSSDKILTSYGKLSDGTIQFEFLQFHDTEPPHVYRITSEPPNKTKEQARPTPEKGGPPTL